MKKLIIASLIIGNIISINSSHIHSLKSYNCPCHIQEDQNNIDPQHRILNKPYYLIENSETYNYPYYIQDNQTNVEPHYRVLDKPYYLTEESYTPHEKEFNDFFDHTSPEEIRLEESKSNTSELDTPHEEESENTKSKEIDSDNIDSNEEHESDNLKEIPLGRSNNIENKSNILEETPSDEINNLEDVSSNSITDSENNDSSYNDASQNTTDLITISNIFNEIINKYKSILEEKETYDTQNIITKFQNLPIETKEHLKNSLNPETVEQIIKFNQELNQELDNKITNLELNDLEKNENYITAAKLSKEISTHLKQIIELFNNNKDAILAILSEEPKRISQQENKIKEFAETLNNEENREIINSINNESELLIESIKQLQDSTTIN